MAKLFKTNQALLFTLLGLRKLSDSFTLLIMHLEQINHIQSLLRHLCNVHDTLLNAFNFTDHQIEFIREEGPFLICKAKRLLDLLHISSFEHLLDLVAYGFKSLVIIVLHGWHDVFSDVLIHVDLSLWLFLYHFGSVVGIFIEILGQLLNCFFKRQVLLFLIT